MARQIDESGALLLLIAAVVVACLAGAFLLAGWR